MSCPKDDWYVLKGIFSWPLKLEGYKNNDWFVVTG